MAYILLVEDEQWLGELYTTLLQKAGHTVRWCRDNYEAIDALDEVRPDLIVLDLLLPWSNGLQLLHELASHHDLAAIPVILCSNALPSRESGQGWMAHYGIIDVFHKAKEHPRQLLQKVNEGISHARFSN